MSSKRYIWPTRDVGTDGKGATNNPYPWAGAALSLFSAVEMAGPHNPAFLPVLGPVSTYFNETTTCESYTETTLQDPSGAFAIAYCYVGDVLHARASFTADYNPNGLGGHGSVRLVSVCDYGATDDDNLIDGAYCRFDGPALTRVPATIAGSIVVTTTGWAIVKLCGQVSAATSTLTLRDCVSIRVDVQRRGGHNVYDPAENGPTWAAAKANQTAAYPSPWNVPHT